MSSVEGCLAISSMGYEALASDQELLLAAQGGRMQPLQNCKGLILLAFISGSFP
jgi:hypothetical protein